MKNKINRFINKKPLNFSKKIEKKTKKLADKKLERLSKVNRKNLCLKAWVQFFGFFTNIVNRLSNKLLFYRLDRLNTEC